jgi:glutamate racemase
MILPMIGMFDSGSGGLTILAGCRALLPGQSFLYLGDHARAPYGEKSAEQILESTRQMVEALYARGCGLVLLACNTASAVALRDLQENWLPAHYPDRRLLGVLVPMVEALTGLPWDRDEPGLADEYPASVGVFATRRTVESGAYSREISRRAPACRVIEQACPGLVSAIERGAGHDELAALVGGFVGELLARTAKETGRPPEVVLLGCTHYPLLEELFRQHLPAATGIISQPDVVARSLWAYLQRHPQMAGEKDAGALQLLTTGDPENIIDPHQFMADFMPSDLPTFERLQ